MYLLDGTRFVLRVFPTTTVGGILLSIREKIGIVHDSHYGLFETGDDSEFRLLDEHLLLSKIMHHWSSLSGAFSLHFFTVRAARSLSPSLSHTYSLETHPTGKQARTPSTTAASYIFLTVRPLRRS